MIAVPSASVLVALTEPPCASTTSRTIASPSPEPVDDGPFTKRSKTRGSRSAGIPVPSSRTVRRIHPLEAIPSTPMVPPGRAHQRVADEVAQNSAHPRGICVQRRKVDVDPLAELHPGRPRVGSEGLQCLVDQDSDVNRLAMETQRAALGKGEGAEVVHEHLQQLRRAHDRGHVLGIGRVDAVSDRLRLSADYRKGRAQLVAMSARTDRRCVSSASRRPLISSWRRASERRSDGPRTGTRADRSPASMRWAPSMSAPTGATKRLSTRSATRIARPPSTSAVTATAVSERRRVDRAESAEHRPYDTEDRAQEHEEREADEATDAPRDASPVTPPVRVSSPRAGFALRPPGWAATTAPPPRRPRPHGSPSTRR